MLRFRSLRLGSGHLPSAAEVGGIAGASTEATRTPADQLIDNTESFVLGRPTNVVEGAF